MSPVDVIGNIDRIGPDTWDADLVSPITAMQLARVRAAGRSAALALQKDVPESRELDIALQHIEAATLWASHAVVLPRQEPLFES